jgi:hypothetical protein
MTAPQGVGARVIGNNAQVRIHSRPLEQILFNPGHTRQP